MLQRTFIEASVVADDTAGSIRIQNRLFNTAEIAQVFPDKQTGGTVLLLRDGSRFVASQGYWWFVQRLTGGETAMEEPQPLVASR